MLQNTNFLIFFVLNCALCAGTTASPCETNNYSECIQNLARTVQTLQQRVDTLSTQMDHQTNLLDQQLSQLVSQSMQINETRANVAKLKNDYGEILIICSFLSKFHRKFIRRSSYRFHLRTTSETTTTELYMVDKYMARDH